MDDHHKPTGAVPTTSPPQKPQSAQKPARQSHYLDRLHPSGPDGRLARVSGSAIALLDTARQTEFKLLLLKASKKQYRGEIDAAFADVDA